MKSKCCYFTELGFVLVLELLVVAGCHTFTRSLISQSNVKVEPVWVLRLTTTDMSRTYRSLHK